MSAEIESLLAKQAITEQLCTYCRSVDRLDAELFRSVYHSDATIDYSVDQFRGRAADLADAFMEAHASAECHTHGISNVLIKVVGDQAVSETYAHAVLHFPASDSTSPINRHYRGRYLDKWTKREGRWAISHRQLVAEMSWEEEVSGGSFGELSRRDRNDPVYELYSSISE